MENGPTRVISEALLFSESVQQRAQVPVGRGDWAWIRASTIMSALEEAGYDVIGPRQFDKTFFENES